MKFITEDDLRDLYRKAPFTEYVIEPGTRITPGARQFLADRQIFLPDEEPVLTGRNISLQASKPGKPAKEKTAYSKRLGVKMKSVETLFLLIAEELLSRDILLAQKIIGLKKCFTDIRKAIDGGTLCQSLTCEGCTGIKEDNFSQDLGDCFEITEFHIQLGKGKEIISLHRLRCSLREMQLDIEEAFENCNDTKQCDEVTGKVNQIINTLSQMICYTAGGETCQRKD